MARATSRSAVRSTVPSTGGHAGVADGGSDSLDPSPARPGLNLAVVSGQCSAGVEIRVLESGRRVGSLSIRTPADASPRGRRSGSTAATSVPVTVWDPPAWLEAVAPGDALVVVGTIRRRFFATRTGIRGAKSEVEAVSIARATKGQLASAWQRASAALEAIV
jgi:single-stranded DNA-binding protein